MSYQLDYGSRYTATDQSRSSFDDASNAEVNAQLKPVDAFVTDMTVAANVDGHKFDGVDLFLFHPHTDPDISEDNLKQMADLIASKGLKVGSLVAPVWGGTVGDSAMGTDEQQQKFLLAIEKACRVAKLLNQAGVSFAVLGAEESCTGDPARRAGNEFLFQMQALTNIEVLNGYSVQKIVAACPHCFNTLKNEYPQLGGTYEVFHHSQFIEQAVEPLLKGKRLMPLAQAQQTKRLLANAREELLQPTEQALKKPPRITVTRAKAQPQALPLLRQVLAELDGQ